jgi:signal transduction histidine kinase
MMQAWGGAGGVGRWVLAGFVGILLSFGIAMLSTQWLAAGIRDAADEIAGNGSPMAQLVVARTELRHLEVALEAAVERHVGGDNRRADALAVAHDRTRLEEQWKRYAALPVEPGAAALRPSTEQSLARLWAASDVAIAAHDPGVAERALDDARLAADGVDASIRGLQNFDLADNTRLATAIKTAWRRSVAASVVAIALVIIMSLMTARAVARLIRQSARSLDRAHECQEFAGRVAHDLANPIAAARMTLALAHETMSPNATPNPFLDRISATLCRANCVLQDLYRYAEAGHAGVNLDSRADVSEVLRGVIAEVRPTAERQNIEISVEDSRTATVACRPGVLTSIMTNLVENALKHMGQSAERRVAVHVREGARNVRIEVEDFGPGIEPAIIGHIFDPYVRGSTSASGLGLGLATVKRLTEGHGGKVGVRSSVGKGSVFWLELPRAAAPTVES